MHRRRRSQLSRSSPVGTRRPDRRYRHRRHRHRRCPQRHLRPCQWSLTRLAGRHRPRQQPRPRHRLGRSRRRTVRLRLCRCNRSSRQGTGPMDWVCCPRRHRCRARRKSRPRPCRLGCPIRSSGPRWRRRFPRRSWLSRLRRRSHLRRRRCRRCRRSRRRRSRSARLDRQVARPWRLLCHRRRSRCSQRSVCRPRSRLRPGPERIRPSRCSPIPRRHRSRTPVSSRSSSCSCSWCHPRQSWWLWR